MSQGTLDPGTGVRRRHSVFIRSTGGWIATIAVALLFLPGTEASGPATTHVFSAPFPGANYSSSATAYSLSGCSRSIATWSAAPKLARTNGSLSLAGTTADKNCPGNFYLQSVWASSYAVGGAGLLENYTAVRGHLTNVTALWSLSYSARLSASGNATAYFVITISVDALDYASPGFALAEPHSSPDYTVAKSISGATTSFHGSAKSIDVWGDFRFKKGHTYAVLTTVDADLYVVASSGTASATLSLTSAARETKLNSESVRIT